MTGAPEASTPGPGGVREASFTPFPISASQSRQGVEQHDHDDHEQQQRAHSDRADQQKNDEEEDEKLNDAHGGPFFGAVGQVSTFVQVSQV